MRWRWASLVVLYALVSCQRSRDSSAATLSGAISPNRITAEDIRDFALAYPGSYRYVSDILQVYQARKGQLFWVDSTGFTPQAYLLMSWLAETDIQPSANSYPFSALDKYKVAKAWNYRMPGLEEEWFLTAYYYCSAHEWEWRSLSQQEQRGFGMIPEKPIDLYARWGQLSQGWSVVGNFFSVPPEYQRLHKAWQDLMDRRVFYPAGEITSQLLSAQEGDSSPDIDLMQRGLQFWGDVKGEYIAGKWDGVTTKALRHFQYRMGLKQQDVVDAATWVELNKPLEFRISQLVVNLERNRRVAPRTSSPYLQVNLASAELTLVKNERAIWSCRAIVGKSSWPTSVFRANLVGVEFNPHWHVPTKILKEEMLADIQHDPSWLTREHYEVLDACGKLIPNPEKIDWYDSSKINRLHIRQQPGPWNALGKVRFDISNSFGIYLHDTPYRTLFSKTDRALSHGCIRVEDPYRLLRWLLTGLPPRDSIGAVRHWFSDKTTYVHLADPVPVYLVYATAWVDSAGSLCLRSDLYGADARLEGFLRDNGMVSSGPRIHVWNSFFE